MGQGGNLVIRNARLADGRRTDIAIEDGVITAFGDRFASRSPMLDARNGTLIPGLCDNHMHLLATAARMESVELADATTAQQIASRIRAAGSPGWVRAIGYDEAVAGLLDSAAIDAWENERPVRIQDRTGALWMLNTAGMARLGPGPFPDCVERDRHGAPTGRIWRGDVWLRAQLDDRPPSLAPLSRSLAALGITSVTDASAGNGPSEAALFSRAVAEGMLLQRLTLMGKEDLPAGVGYRLGPLKLLLDERDLPDPAVVAARIRSARLQGRPVAAHCTTTAELLLYLAALEAAGGARAGDRVEHGSVIPESLIPDLVSAGLAVVSQPGFVFERGDRYCREMAPDALCDLYRLHSLAAAGIPIAAGSDAPYGDIDPWLGIRAAIDRRTRNGKLIGAGEALSAKAAVALYLPGGQALAPGMPADLCLLAGPLEQALAADSNPVLATIVAGRVVHERCGIPFS